jgi:hypothetical protein
LAAGYLKKAYYVLGGSMSIEFSVRIKLVQKIKMCLNNAYSKFLIGKYLSDKFPIRSGIKGGDALRPFLFIFASVYAIGKVQENRRK